jgi:L-ascorbate metabolism protein UlaG (beta-lactamase superfamily)
MRKTETIAVVMLFTLLLLFPKNEANTAVSPDTFAIHNLGHASLYFKYKSLIIHVDPVSSQAKVNYDTMPDADIIFITHAHSDHYDPTTLNKIRADSTVLVCTQAVKNLGTYQGGATLVLKNGDSGVVKGIPVKAVPAYNISNSNHPQGVGNGYVLTFGEKRIYIAGDTELIPAMDSLGKIDIAFLPMNLPYTMSVSMAADAAKKIQPSIVYIYHFSNSDTASLRNLLSGRPMEVRMGASLFYESDKRQAATGILNGGKKTEVPVKKHSGNTGSSRHVISPGGKVSLIDATGRVIQLKRISVQSIFVWTIC